MIKLEKLNSDLFKPLIASKAQAILGGAANVGLTFIGYKQRGDKILNDYMED